MNDTCVCCGEYVPEDRMICIACEKKYDEKDDDCYGSNRSLNMEQLRFGLFGLQG